MHQYYADRSADITQMEAEHSAFVRRTAGECMVLLENDGILPLSAPCPIALYGNGARNTIKGGTGSGDVNSRSVVNIEEGLEAAGFTVTSKAWLDAQQQCAAEEYARYRQHLEAVAREKNVPVLIASFTEQFFPTALAPFSPADGDTAVYVLSRNSGEGIDRQNAPGDYWLSEAERSFLTTLGQQYAHVILLLNIGGVIDAADFRSIPGISAVLLISQMGNMGGHITADVLLGRTCPSGRLTDTWAARYEDYSSSAGYSHNNGDTDDEYYTDGIYVGYRYFDAFDVTPVYPFGYGLNYTEFSMTTESVSADPQAVSVSVRVQNIGSQSGREVVQVYASAPRGRLEKPMQVLAGFGKTRLLAPGEEQLLTISFPLANLESFDPDRSAYLLEGGSYIIRVGRHSRDTHAAAVITLDTDAITRKVRHICPLDEPLEEISAAGVRPWTPQDDLHETASAPVIALSAADIAPEEIRYPEPPAELPELDTEHTITMEEVRAGLYSMEQLVAQLTVEEMADLCVAPARRNSSVIGSAAQRVPGAAGETSTRLAYRGVRDMVNADGPAGLRLTAHFRTDSEGNLLPGSSAFGMEQDTMGEKQDGEIDYYQYCTAIPIAWALASSWDLELIRRMGAMVGEEMEHFGVRIWLAPGMNIHRNPLCGRNFEYYSEDPLFSGLCAAADVNGVQSCRGIGTSIKHFFANNQEDNRMFVNEHISERALREIYLRNFAVCIQASQPMTIMTSYNLVNGIHTANSYDAITCFARAECGFAGYVMTDWSTSDKKVAAVFYDKPQKYPSSDSPLCVAAGNDVQMPGCQENYDDILTAVADGSLTKAQLQQCCIRLLNTDLLCASFPDSAQYAASLPKKAFLCVR